jgi:hypothetical protein
LRCAAIKTTTTIQQYYLSSAVYHPVKEAAKFDIFT